VSKKSVQINIAVTPEIASRAHAIFRSRGIKPTEVARAGFEREIQRIEHEETPVTPAVLKAIADFRRLTGQCPVATLRAATKQHLAQA
jgi:predicted Fe-Mo cluster-binding NifX family protein